MNKITAKAIAGVSVVFLLGVITGALGTGIVVRRGIRQFVERAPDTHRNILMRRLTRELQLTETQRPQVEAIVQAGEEEIRAFMQQSHTDFSAMMQRRIAEIKAILTLEQQQQLDRIVERLQKRWPPPPPQ